MMYQAVKITIEPRSCRNCSGELMGPPCQGRRVARFPFFPSLASYELGDIST